MSEPLGNPLLEDQDLPPFSRVRASEVLPAHTAEALQYRVLDREPT